MWHLIRCLNVGWLLLPCGAPAEQRADDTRLAAPAPTFADVSYGPHESNKLDFWKAPGATPAPLVVFIHGGGFQKGDKTKIDPWLLQACLEAGMSCASIDYRLSVVAIYPAQMHDSARAVQFLRSKAAEWNIDPKRVACTGNSAGSGIAQWLAFHDDLADPASDDPVARQSTRLTCAIPTNMQCTYDPREIKKIVPGAAYDIGVLKKLHGLPETFDWDKDRIDADLDARVRDASPLTHLTKDDPPVFATNDKSYETDGNIHHPNFGRYLKEQMDALGIECEFHLEQEIGKQERRAETIVAFLKKHFGMEQARRAER